MLASDKNPFIVMASFHSHIHQKRHDEHQHRDGEEQTARHPRGKREPEWFLIPLPKEWQQPQDGRDYRQEYR